MAEICIPPVTVRLDGEDHDAFGPHHSLADIVRWLMRNRSEAEEVRDMLTEALADA